MCEGRLDLEFHLARNAALKDVSAVFSGLAVGVFGFHVCPCSEQHLRLGFRVQGSGFRVQGSGFRVQDSGFRVQGSGFRVQGSG